MRIQKQRFGSGLLGLPLGLALCHCGKVDYRPAFPAEAVLSVEHLGAYSSQLGEDKEIPGTLFQTRWKFEWKKAGEGFHVRRRLDSLFGKGYHKLSMANELERKVDLEFDLGPDRVPRRITGYDSLHAVLARLPQQHAGFKEHLLRSADTVRLQAMQRDVFRLRRFLPEGVLALNTKLAVEEVNKQLETFRLDSALYQVPRPRLRRNCLEYEVYYHRMDSLPLLVEQFFYSAAKNRKWKHSKWAPGKVEGIRHFSVDRETGLPCFESITETGRVTLLDAENKAEQPITLYRYEEDIFEP